MKKIIIQTLSAIIGQPMWGSTRFIAMQTFDFGNRMPDPCCGTSPRDKGDFTLQVQTTWRICAPQTILVASHDRYLLPDGSGQSLSEFDWDRPGNNRCDVQIEQIWKMYSPLAWVVKKVDGDDLGGLKIYFNGDLSLELFPDSSSAGEYWRFFSTFPYSRPLIVSSQGIL